MWTYKANVVKIIDGDTIVLDIDLGFGIWVRNEHIRLYGIDTPEIRTKNLVEKAAGNLAKERVLELIGEHNIIKIITINDKSEKFGRMFGIIFNHEGVNINDTLLNERLAVKYNGESKELLLENQNSNIEYLISTSKLILNLE
jgi:micrococcal nuclease